MGNVFFNSEWMDKTVYFPLLQTESMAIQYTMYKPCSFKITKKLYEKCNQFSAEEYENENLSSDTEGLFECTLSGDESTFALMLIYMQVPHTESDFFSGEDRRNQGSGQLSIRASNEFEALKTLHSQGCTSSPWLINYKQEKQDLESRFIPDGYILYIVFDQVPGVALTEDYFWGLSRAERDQIRAAFQRAFTECLQLGVENYHCDITKLNWSKSDTKIFLTKFQFANLTERNNIVEWTLGYWSSWSLADPPGSYHAELPGRELDSEGWAY